MKCRCEADTTTYSPRRSVHRGRKRKVRKSRMVSHTRRRDGACFWHWEDQGWQLIKPGEEYADG